MQRWTRTALIVMAVVVVAALAWLAADRIVFSNAPRPGAGRSTADAVYLAVVPKTGEIATGTVSAAHADAAANYLEARIAAASASRREWNLVPWGTSATTGPERVDARSSARTAPAQRLTVYHYADGSALRIAEDPKPIDGVYNAYVVVQVQISRP
jgi:hypothetical protein